MENSILDVKKLSVYVTVGDRKFPAVRNVSFSVLKGEIFGIVGESGCGKTLTALSVPELLSDGIFQSESSVLFDGVPVHNLPAREKRSIYGKDISVIFQEPMTALNPLVSIHKQVEESLRLHTNMSKMQRHERVKQCLLEVGIRNVEQVMEMYPHELSGGMRQRVMIASAVICRPKLLIADEPTTALDMTTQNQVLGLMRKINASYGTAILFISHDLKVVSSLCNRMAVMYAGSFVEQGSVRDVFTNPCHEYTKGLLNSIPSAEKKGTRLECIQGKVPSVTESKMACAFAPRCNKAEQQCYIQIPEKKVISQDHCAWCHFSCKGEL
ncbi:MAG: ABC transporter ATP-binding protein [Treponema sp.]|nr:ABC transporter ATP-binding protein [Treponema sp.]